MKVKVKVEKIDFHSKSEEILTEVTGILEGNQLNYLENNVVSKVIIDKQSIIIKRKSEMEVNIYCVEGKETEMIINVPEGEFSCAVYTHKLNIEKNRIYVDYEIDGSNDVNDRFIFIIEYYPE